MAYTNNQAIETNQETEPMKTKDFTFKFSGSIENLSMFVFSGCRFYSQQKIENETLTLTYMTEDGDYDACLDCINMSEADLWGVELVSA